jgi:Family of unknown function (DUF6785)/Domain of unknown function (DUF6784)
VTSLPQTSPRDPAAPLQVGPSPPTPALTPRAIGLSLLLIVVICWWVVNSEIRTTTTEITCTSLPIGVLFVLFCVCCVNLSVSRRWPGRALSGGELAVVYILTATGSAVSGIGLIGFLTPAIANPVYFATDGNHWTAFLPLLPAWLIPQDRDALRDFYAGNSTLYTVAHLRAWLLPLASWGLFMLVLFGTTLCLMAILRRQWVVRERLAFPIVELPLEMTVRRGGFEALLRGRAFQFGFLLPCLLQSLNSLAYLYPSIPSIPVKPSTNGPLDLGPYFTSPPWSALGYFPLGFHPSTIGLSFLLSVEVSFSCWFFYLARKLEIVYAVAAGWGGAGSGGAAARMPFIQEQGTGAWLAVAAASLWLARRAFRDAWRSALRPPPAADPGAPMSDRAAMLGLAGGAAFLLLFALASGMSLPVAALLLGGFFVLMVALARIRAESGTAWHFGPWVKVHQLPVRVWGEAALGPRNLTALATHGWYNLEYRSTPVPHQIEALKIAEEGRFVARGLAFWMMVALAVGIVAALWSVLHLYYAQGAGTAKVNAWRINMGRIPWNALSGQLRAEPGLPDIPGLQAMGVGAAITLGLAWLRTRFPWWPFHPVGFALGNSFELDLLWCQFFVGWLCKVVALRYGGIRAYRAALPFFIGLILGDYVIASLWTILGSLTGATMYRCFPN